MERFDSPQANSLPLDWCISPGCGYSAALFFCQQHGYSAVARYAGFTQVPETYQLDTGNICSPGWAGCGTFGFIECAGLPVPPPTMAGSIQSSYQPACLATRLPAQPIALPVPLRTLLQTPACDWMPLCA